VTTAATPIGALPPAVAAGPRRIVVASPMKAASTYTAEVLARYLGTSVPVVRYDWLAEQNYTDELARQVGDGPFVLALHLRPHASNLERLTRDGIRVVLLWRNLGDVIVSFDEHVPRYGVHNPMFYVDHDAFVGMHAQERYRHAIDALVPWNVGFYLHWRGLPGLVLNPYELLVRDPRAYFAQVIVPLGVALDHAWLAHVLAEPVAVPRWNVGAVGRSGALFADETKRRLESHLLAHPQRDETDVLLRELPWDVAAFDPRAPYDGMLVAVEPESPFFVSRGVRHPVARRWVASRGPESLREPTLVTRAALDALPLGAALD